MNNTENELNALLADEIENLLVDYNKWSIESNSNLVPGIVLELDRTQDISDTNDLVKLSPPVSGDIKNITLTDESTNKRINLISRAVFSYALVVQLLNLNKKEALNRLKPIFKATLNSHLKKIPFSSNTLNSGIYLTSKRPDGSNTIKELQEYAGFEFCLFTNTIPLE